MSGEILHIEPEGEFRYSIDYIMELYGLDQWTIRMWVCWFKIPGHLSTDDGNIVFTGHALKQIGVICRMMKKKMKLKELHKYLESGKSLEEM